MSIEYQDIPLTQIKEPEGIIRLEIPHEKIVELAESIRHQGLLQPIVVRQINDHYEIVAGHRRYLAFQYLTYPVIPCRIIEMDDTAVALARATENLTRQDLTPIEEGAIYKDLRDTHNLSYEEIGKRMGKSAGAIKRRIDLLRMPPDLQKALHERKINMSVAEELWSLGDSTAISYYLPFAIENGATKDVVRGWVKDYKDTKRREASSSEQGDSLPNPMEKRPVWVACDLCTGPMELGTETVIRACPDCIKRLKEALR